ncbi:hypothetical protein BKA67DRAFT_265141 [Truncatella angustata]|uniref:Uncharacterized protein n=1 Tax=Truncatella angustata TaxID=152316 RepID=A0A9P8UKN6_9PEZI|nr:uncharacterized protein BKA67DRAFT_265141 [Truncatella angustata]KAH6653936.1 hypothetical protein BKA67DRAFT_265141 [Truncatella angustata]
MVRLISALMAAAMLREGFAAPAAPNNAIEERQFPTGKGSGVPTGSFPIPTGSFPGFPVPTGSFPGFPIPTGSFPGFPVPTGKGVPTGRPLPPRGDEDLVVERAEATPTGKGKGKGTGRPTGLPVPTGKGKGTGKPTGKGPKPTGGFGIPPE